MKKFTCILGRAPKSDESSKKFTWEIDVDLGENKKISRQHAIILFNFQTQNFEIKCISKRGYVKVNSNVCYSYDNPIVLKNRAYITIGPENFYFLLPSEDEIKDGDPSKKIHI